MTTYHADDVSNEPTGDVQGATGPTTYHADWVPDVEPESKTVAAPKKTAARKQSRASSKRKG